MIAWYILHEFNVDFFKIYIFQGKADKMSCTKRKKSFVVLILLTLIASQTLPIKAKFNPLNPSLLLLTTLIYLHCSASFGNEIKTRCKSLVTTLKEKGVYRSFVGTFKHGQLYSSSKVKTDESGNVVVNSERKARGVGFCFQVLDALRGAAKDFAKYYLVIAAFSHAFSSADPEVLVNTKL